MEKEPVIKAIIFSSFFFFLKKDQKHPQIPGRSDEKEKHQDMSPGNSWSLYKGKTHTHFQTDRKVHL